MILGRHILNDRRRISLERLMEIELPVSRRNGWHLVDSRSVVVVNRPSLVLSVTVARSERGYHAGVSYETATGGATGGAYDRDPYYPTKLAALRGALSKAMEDYWIIKHPGNRGHIAAALQELSKYECRQLTLF